MGPLPARSIMDRDCLQRAMQSIGKLSTLLLFENCDPTLPIIIGCVNATPAAPAPVKQAIFPSKVHAN